ncbi:MAG: PEP-CTERM sorting domain-containing protein [Planctomycetes bacterium]|nr:PEP-CTERM sorting domain-containing protein [Planctomycetota bacterium]
MGTDMAQTTAKPPWADNETWMYSGQFYAPGNVPIVSTIQVDSGATMKMGGFRGYGLVDVQGTGTLVVGENTSTTKELRIAGPISAPTAVLDLTTGGLVIDYADGASPIAQIAGWIKAGYNRDAGGYWDGKGITSSVAATQDLDSNGEIDLLTAIGVADNMKWNPDLDEGLGGYEARFTEFGGVAVDMTSVLAKYTYWGDANLDGAVTFDDYDVIDYYYWFPLPADQMGWWTGDFNMDGAVTFDDYDLIDYAYWFQGPQLSNGLNGVPEPATLALLGLGALAAIARRRRQA